MRRPEKERNEPSRTRLGREVVCASHVNSCVTHHGDIRIGISKENEREKSPFCSLKKLLAKHDVIRIMGPNQNKPERQICIF